jgi:hypothetical protein
MYFPNRNLNPRDRVIFQIGNFSLVAGLLLWMFVHPASQIEKNWLHAICGFLLGLSITISLLRLRFARRCTDVEAPTGTASAPQP